MSIQMEYIQIVINIFAVLSTDWKYSRVSRETIDFPQRCDADGITPDGKRIWITNTVTIME